MPTTTALSTAETDQLIALLMPAGHAALLRKACNTHSKAKAKAAAMRAKRSADLQALVHDAIHVKQLILEKKHRCRWTSILMRHFARHGIEAPDIETVRKHVKEFSGF